MNDYKNIKDVVRKGAVYHAMVCLLASISDEELELLSLPYELSSDIAKARSEDDYLGVGAAFYVSALSNNELTASDELVCGQVLTVGGATILAGGVVTKKVLDKEDVLTNKGVFEELYDWITTSVDKTKMTSSTFMENTLHLVEYMEQYNRYVVDKSNAYFKSNEEGEVETPDGEGSLWRYFGF